MEQFSLEKWLKDKSRKIVTRNGKPVRIVCWDKLGDYPIIGCIKYSDDYEDLESYYSNGFKYSFDREDQNDLFFADKEEELTEIEKTMIQFSHERNSLIQFEHTTEEINAHLYLYSKKILDLARKEICLTCKEYSRGYQEGLKLGREDALKDLPKWKKATEQKDFNCLVARLEDNRRVVIISEVLKGDYYIELNDLKTLPKEE